MVDQAEEIIGFSAAVQKLTIAFPRLQIRSSIDAAEPQVQAVASIPPQPGLEYGLGFLLVGDELHLEIGTTSFYVPWFPSTDPVVVDRFVEAIAGFIEGRNRVLESYIGEQIVKCQLQRPAPAGGWQTIATEWTLLNLVPWPRRREIVRNTAANAPRSSNAGA